MLLNETVDSNTFLTTGGIFVELQSKSYFTWLNNKDNALDLDIQYYFNRSGEKSISPLFIKLLDNYNAETSLYTVLAQLGRIIFQTYANKWNSLYNNYINSSYNPLYNKKMEEIITPNINTSSTETHGSKTTTTSTDNTANKTFGFNSKDAVDSDSSNTQSTQTTEGLAADNTDTSQRSKTGTETTTNQGYDVDKIQDNVEAEITLRSKYNFYQIMMEDIDKILVTRIYE